VALCVNTYANCSGAKVTTSGTATATLEFTDYTPGEGPIGYTYDYDLETRLSVPASCVAGGNCESIGCFAGDKVCSCVNGNGSSGTVSNSWTPVVTGENHRDGRGRTHADQVLRRRHDRRLDD
jgi:hypothetical protein